MEYFSQSHYQITVNKYCTIIYLLRMGRNSSKNHRHARHLHNIQKKKHPKCSILEVYLFTVLTQMIKCQYKVHYKSRSTCCKYIYRYIHLLFKIKCIALKNKFVILLLNKIFLINGLKCKLS